MHPGEDTVPRTAIPAASATPAAPAIPAAPAEPGSAAEDTVGRRAVPEGPRFDSPPPVRLAPPPSGPALSVLNRVRVGDGSPVVLATPVIIGRAPGRPRLGGAVARIAVPSPRLQVSGDHLEITQQGGAVVLRDLRSTNGSTVLVPGQAPRTLSRGDSTAVPVGTVVELGEGIRVEILGPAETPGA